MATPHAARPRDLAQVVRDLQKQVRALNTRVIRRERLNITEGDLVVRGGGSIVSEYSDGTQAVVLGPLDVGVPGQLGRGVRLNAPDGTERFSITDLPVDQDYWPHGGVMLRAINLELAVISATGDGGVSLFAGNQSMFMTPADGLLIDCPAGVSITTPTTATGANAFLDPTTGQLRRSTSSRRYKQDIAPATVDTAKVLELTPREFRTKAEVEAQGEDAPTHVGFIAEEAAELGLDAWVTSDAEGPEAFDYATFCVAQQAVMREQAATIADLTARLERLEQAN